jgi:ABC-type ATPase with predicted acetyltransferase domain
MPTYSVSKIFGRGVQITERSAAVMRMFGLTVDRLAEKTFTINCRLEINDGDIVYITGPSGAGKSVLSGEIEKFIPASDRINLNEIKLPGDKTLIDCIGGDFMEGLGLLSIAGLGDAFCVLSRPAELSDGQKYRFRLATALASGKRFIFADEFCCGLDRITAAAISYNVQKFAKRNGVTFVLAGTHEDILGDLAPDVLVVKELSGATEVIYKDKRARCEGAALLKN